MERGFWVCFVVHQVLRELFEESRSPFLSVAALKLVIASLVRLIEEAKVASGLPLLVKSSVGK